MRLTILGLLLAVTVIGCSAAQVKDTANILKPVIAPIANAVINDGLSDLSKQPDMVYLVAKGDTLWSISQRLYGTGFMWPAIATSNATVIQDKDCIKEGMTLYYFKTLSEQVQTASKVTAYATPSYIQHSCQF